MLKTFQIVLQQKALKTDLLAAAIIIAAVIMFVGTSGVVVPQVISSIFGAGESPDRILATTMMLNIALIILGWNRYKNLASEVVERREAEEQAKALARTDPLTKCLNRRTIAERTSDLLARAEDIQKKVAFIMLDLDNFKNINDMQGHEAGDRVLIEVASRLQSVMPPNALVSRLGGDEFACAFIFDPATPLSVERVCEDIIEKVSLPIACPQCEMNVTTSIGIDCGDDRSEQVDGMMRRADIAMYFSKKSGRNRFTWFTQSMENELQTRNQIEAGMRRGIPKGEFTPYYEQQVDLETDTLVGFEVLARWDSPELGKLSPEIFIPIAEETGMINELSESVIEQAMMDARHWDSSLTISVNISPVQLRDPWLSQKLVKLLVKTGFPANRLEVEITESCLFENIELAQTIVGSLKNQGVRVALDDFGTGYSSLAHLRSLPFDRIKIDRSFISSINENPESAAIVQAIASLGESMSMPITAEGIEDSKIVDHLRGIGCMKGQGFLYGRPEAVNNTRKLLATRNLLNNTADKSIRSDAKNIQKVALDHAPKARSEDNIAEPRKVAGGN